MLRATLSRVVGPCIAVLLFAELSRGQAINVDIDVMSSSSADPWRDAPGSTYGAASGQAGLWNAVTLTAPTTLLTATGQSTGVQFQIINPGALQGAGGIFPINSGDYARLMNDFFTLRPGVAATCRFSGLAPGTYEVWTYAGHIGVATAGSVTVDGVSNSIQGQAPLGAFAPGLSHTVHTLTTQGTIDIDVLRFANAEQFGIEGFQIVPIPTPGVGAAVGIIGLPVLLRRMIRRG